MKPYLLFAGEKHEHAGGVEDFVAAYDSIEEAGDVARSLCDKSVYGYRAFFWWHVVEHATMEVVATHITDRLARIKP